MPEALLPDAVQVSLPLLEEPLIEMLSPLNQVAGGLTGAVPRLPLTAYHLVVKATNQLKPLRLPFWLLAQEFQAPA